MSNFIKSSNSLKNLVDVFKNEKWDEYILKNDKLLQNCHDYVFGAHNKCYVPIQNRHFKKSSHQLQCRNSALDTFAKHLEDKMAGKTKNDFSDFECLYDYLRPQDKIKYIGDITIYDAIFRLGLNLGILPRDYVYLHRGAMFGAVKILKKRNLNFREPITIFPKEIQSLGWLIEPFLCIKKNEF